MRVTCDANVLVRAAVRPKGPARAVLEDVLQPPHVLVLSTQIADDVRRVLAYDRMQRQARLTIAEIEAFVSALSEQADMVVIQEPVPHLSPDPDDDLVLATAVGGRADVLCTRDTDILNPTVRAYCAMHGVRLLNDVELLAELRPGKPDESGTANNSDPGP